MKSRLILIFALFLTLTSFRSDENAVKQSDSNILRNANGVITPPKVTEPLKNVVTPEGTDARFEFSFGGNPTCTVEWFREDKPIQNGGRYVMSVRDGVAILIIRQVSQEDSGKYWAKISNAAGTAQTGSILTVDISI